MKHLFSYFLSGKKIIELAVTASVAAGEMPDLCTSVAAHSTGDE
jgi:hypothetical protein